MSAVLCERELAAKVLDDAADLVERGWCQGQYALDADGKFVSSFEETAVCWCLRGAIFRAEYDILPPDGMARNLGIEALCRVVGCNTTRELTDWNDHPKRTQAEVVVAIRAAAESLR